MEASDRIIVALDVTSREEVATLCRLLSGRVKTLKVGLQLFVSEGPPIVRDVLDAGFDVFLDLKLHDIPEQVARTCAETVGMGVSMLTVHASGGRQMLIEAVEATRAAARERNTTPPVLVGVTVLTSLDGQNLAELGIDRTVEDQVLGLASLALDCGLDGVVASPMEVGLLRRELGDGFTIVTPGVRPSWAGVDDQKRTTRPGEALAAGASYLVIGRPVTRADDPAAALAAVIDEIRSESHQSS